MLFAFYDQKAMTLQWCQVLSRIQELVINSGITEKRNNILLFVLLCLLFPSFLFLF